MWQDYLNEIRYAPCSCCGRYGTMVLDERKDIAICSNCGDEFSFKDYVEEMGYMWDEGLSSYTEDEKEEVFDSFS